MKDGITLETLDAMKALMPALPKCTGFKMSAATYSKMEHEYAVQAWISPMPDMLLRPFGGVPIEIDNTIPFGKVEPLS